MLTLLRIETLKSVLCAKSNDRVFPLKLSYV
jgi:hypothetical protein